MVKIYEDILGERPRIERAIARYGYAPEHHFEWYQYNCEPHEKNIFVEFDDGSALFTLKDIKKPEYQVFSSPVASPERRIPVLIEYINHVFNELGGEKIWFELEAPLRREFLRVLPESIRAMPINYPLTWPVTDMATFDPELPGGHYKSIRKEKHKFYRNHFVEVRDAKNFEDRDALHRIIDGWKKNRGANDRSYPFPYHHMIDGNFEGATEARIFMVDGKPVGINAGWMVPNSNRYYGAVGIHDYSVEDLGTMLYLEDLVWLKLRGYSEVDMAGSDKNTGLVFKNKFCPTSYYKTFVFSIVKRTTVVKVGQPVSID